MHARWLIAILALPIVALGVEAHATDATTGGRIAFCASGNDGEGRGLFSVAEDGTDIQRITAGYDNHPRYRPDGAQIVFDRYANGSDVCFNDSTHGAQDIWLVNADGSDAPVNLTNNKGKVKESFPSWSPAGDRIIFAAVEKGYNADLWIMHPDGTGKERLTSGPAIDRQPSWSPDATTIAFIRDGDVYTMPAPGSSGTVRRLTFTEDPEFFPNWSPDGTTILFGTNEGGGEVYSMAADGTGRTAMTGFPGADGAARWSPDGEEIVFNSWRDGVSEGQLFVMPATGDDYTTHPDGSTSHAATQLTDLRFGAWWADWYREDPLVPPPPDCLPEPLPC